MSIEFLIVRNSFTFIIYSPLGFNMGLTSAMSGTCLDLPVPWGIRVAATVSVSVH